jgi:hypothetical protein
MQSDSLSGGMECPKRIALSQRRSVACGEKIPGFIGRVSLQHRGQKDRFFFVEVKLPADRLNQNQIRFFRQIEAFLNKNILKTRLAPHMPENHWIVLARLKPSQEAMSPKLSAFSTSR